MFSKACEYGIRAVIYIAEQSMEGQRVSLKDIAVEIDSPVAFTAKILQQLAKNNIVQSQKGPTGGFRIDERHLHEVKLIHIVTAIDGESLFRGCGLGLKECSELHPCPIHDKFKSVRDELHQMLQETGIHELATELHGGMTFLKR